MDIEELEKHIIEIVKAKQIKNGGNGGNKMDDFDHILNLSIEDRNAFLQQMVDENKIVIREGANHRMIMLPK
ncbi:hypothetical protein HHL23_09410 [Chryseobacterium sp. RP-3-3]|uniref:Uncharacterized protein n=1 Tax=Chryseobacterium antibioticum TaxID=2728847 RepID=A0A7Y0FRA6_9FLAO|nr:hypothetical protein [Chryseobacterium antibioticum]NML70017.1 hypothetical protein [Chryseobacterium antibioticum]